MTVYPNHTICLDQPQILQTPYETQKKTKQLSPRKEGTRTSRTPPIVTSVKTLVSVLPSFSFIEDWLSPQVGDNTIPLSQQESGWYDFACARALGLELGGEIPSKKVTACHRSGSLQTDSERGGCAKVYWRVLLGHTCKEEREEGLASRRSSPVVQPCCTWVAGDLTEIS